MDTFWKVLVFAAAVVLVVGINAVVWHYMRVHGCHPTFYHQGIAWNCP